jgi:peptide-methionine (S)-S-oxide reductase
MLIAPARHFGSALLLSLVLAAAGPIAAQAAGPATPIPPPTVDAPASNAPGLQSVVLAGGCFWGVQAVFQHTRGVTQALSGYAGGAKEDASYEIVSSGRTGHAEAVHVTFDPQQISLGRILQIYFSVAHDPTQLNRQGPDEGTQYRSAIFYKDSSQKALAEGYIAQLNKTGAFKRPIVTRIDPLAGFYAAEAYHQDYATLHPNNSYIRYNDLPKVENLKQHYSELYLDKPVLVAAAARSN